MRRAGDDSLASRPVSSQKGEGRSRPGLGVRSRAPLATWWRRPRALPEAAAELLGEGVSEAGSAAAQGTRGPGREASQTPGRVLAAQLSLQQREGGELRRTPDGARLGQALHQLRVVQQDGQQPPQHHGWSGPEPERRAALWLPPGGAGRWTTSEPRAAG